MSALAQVRAPAAIERTQRLIAGAARRRRWSRRTLHAGIAMVVAVPLLALVVRLFGLLPDPGQQDLSNVLAAPSLEHPFGTDAVGRDVLARVLSATWLDYQVAIVTTYAPLLIGVTAGALAGYFGGWLDTLLMRLVDVVMAFPFVVFIIAIVAVVGPGLTGVYIGLIGFGWAFYARLTRAEMLVLREQQYIAAAKTLGVPTWRILLVHALPNLLRPSIVTSMSTLVLNILALATLSYLGLGVQPPTAEWGAIVAEGQQYLFTEWWLSTLPGLVIVFVGVGFSLMADGLADRLGIRGGDA